MKKHTKSTSQVKQNKKHTLYKIIFTIALILLIFCIIIIDLFVFPLQKFWLKLSTPLYAKKPEDAMRVHFIDVGQGDSTIIEFPDNTSMIIDGGNDSKQTETTVLKYITSLGIQKFDYLLATHSDTDHVGALDAVLQTYGSKQIYMPYIESADKNAAFASFYTAVQTSKASIHTTQLAQTIYSLNQNFYYLVFLSPTGPDDKNSFYYSTDSNSSSAVLYLEYAGHGLLLSGDAPSKVEEYCLDLYAKGIYQNIVQYPTTSGTVNLPVRLENTSFYKVGHHGSNSSSSASFLKVLQPQEAFVSCGVGNSYGHPHPDVLNRLNQYVKGVHRTDISKNIVLTIYKNGQYTIDYH